MKQSLWILNSSLLSIFVLILLLNNILKQEVPIIKIKAEAGERSKKKLPLLVNVEKIFTHDLFDTYVTTKRQATQKSLITPIPTLKLPELKIPELPQKPEMIPNLNIIIKGIILSSDESQSVSMIADETNKEGIYHIGDKIKDGQIIKISRNKTIILRANGQEEIYLLRKSEITPEEKPEKKWLYTVKKIDDTIYNIDLKEFIQNVPTLGQLLEDFSISTAYKNGEAVGLRIGQLEPDSIAQELGLNKDDILKSIDDTDVSPIKNRIKLYNKISQSEEGDELKIALNRNNEDINLIYKIKKIEKPKKQTFLQAADPTKQVEPVEFKMGPQQQRENAIKEFKNVHYTPQQQNTIHDIRKRLRENMLQRRLNRRVRD